MAAERPEWSRAAWGKRLAYLACGAVLVGVALLLIFGQNDPRQSRVGWDAVSLSVPPPMPAADFLREVRAIGGFAETLDLSDPKTFEQLYQAVSRHEWVEQVEHVGPAGPGRVRVDLTFRKPVARLVRGTQEQFVDRHGKVLLPLSVEQGDDLVRLVGFERANAAWLAEAAELASRLRSDLEAWGIGSIDLVRLRSLDLVELCLRTRGGTYVSWRTLQGGKEEPAFDEKVSRLRTYKERYGTLDLPPGQMLDVREKEGIQRKPLGH